MAGSLASLKSLPCPAGKACTAFQCLFKHENDASDNNEAPPSPDRSKRPDTAEYDPSSPANPDSPRKRVKLGAEAHSSTAALANPRKGPSSTLNQKTNMASPLEPSPARKLVSPSSTRLSPSSAPKPADKKDTASTSAPTSVLPSPPKLDSTPKTATKSAPKKPEVLNPRHLMKSPAGHSIRLKLAEALHEQYTRLNADLKKLDKDEDKKLLLSEQELITKTLDDEQDIAVKKPLVYSNSIRNRIGAYRKMTVQQWKAERIQAVKAQEPQKTKKEPAAPEPVVTGLTLPQEVEFLHRLVWPLSGLEAYGYVATMPSEEDIQTARAGVEASANTEVCDRCTRRFQVFPGRREEDGALASNGKCNFHPGKMYYEERAMGARGRVPRRYRCCHRDVEDDSSGCTTAPNHVFKTTNPKRLASLLNFAETPPNPDIPKDRAVCFDCEMGYTVYGLELIRVTAVAWPNGEELLDVLVQPMGETLDLNTRYSGVRPEDMVQAERLKAGEDHRPTLVPSPDPSKPAQRKLKLAASPKAARDLLFSLIAPTTPLIGHGLENDLNAMRMIHPTCIDTVLLYPHPRGLPIRNGLKYLVESRLGRRIQIDHSSASEEGPEGHDSAEDARAAGDLVRLKVRDEWKVMQLKGWKLEGDKFAPPGEEWTVVGSGGKARKSRAA
ncbi:hypothetical protein F4780DRAFT_637545 [Xylariomycetidae sp. FL0641]|nr:hypothetical protein F4780DRAFT_637545 [Xylariomycetidae sp. FL0641]